MRKIWKKAAAAMLVVLLVLQMTACGNKAEKDTVSESEETVQEDASLEAPDTPVEIPETMQTAPSENPNGIKWGMYDGHTVQEEIMRFKTGVYDRELTPEDLLTVTELEVDGSTLSGLIWLSYMTNLTVLKLPGLSDGFGFTDNLDFLSDIKGLKELDLSGVSFDDINALANLTNLTTLSVSCGETADFSALSNLKNLTSLTLGLDKFDTAAMDAISGLTNLTSLTLEMNYQPRDSEEDMDLSALSNLTNLESLVFIGTRYSISDLSFLSGLQKLTVLRLGSESGNIGIRTTDLSAISNLSNLETLELRFNNEYFGSEETVEEYRRRTCDISPLSNLTKLKELRIGRVSAYIDLNAIAGLTQLETLELPDIPSVTEEDGSIVHYGGDMSCLSGLINLKEITMSGGMNQIASIPSMSNLQTLAIKITDDGDYLSDDIRRFEQAGVYYMPPNVYAVEDILPNLTNLSTLIIKECGSLSYDDWDWFHLPNLTTLVIEDGDALGLALDDREWPNLTSLTLKNGHINGSGQTEEWNSDWNTQFPNLTELTLIGFLGDLSGLSGLPGLTSLTLREFRGVYNMPAGLEHLTELTLGGSGRDADLTKLSGLTTLVVEQGGTDRFSYESLSGLSNLTTVLGASDDIDKITELPALETISFPYDLAKYLNCDLSVLYDRPDLTIQWCFSDPF